MERSVIFNPWFVYLYSTDSHHKFPFEGHLVAHSLCPVLELVPTVKYCGIVRGERWVKRAELVQFDSDTDTIQILFVDSEHVLVLHRLEPMALTDTILLYKIPLTPCFEIHPTHCWDTLRYIFLRFSNRCHFPPMSAAMLCHIQFPQIHHSAIVTP